MFWLLASLAVASSVHRDRPVARGGPDLWSYGYVLPRSEEPIPMYALSHAALFGAEVDATGTVSRIDVPHLASLVVQAQPTDVHVHLAVACFDPKVLDRLLGSSAARANLVVSVRDTLERTGAHGVNLDLEGVPSSRRRDLLELVQDLESAVDEVVVAIPARPSDGYDLQGLGRHAELFVMAYDYHWAGSTHAGPVDPLFAGPGTPWEGVNDWSITRTIEDVVNAGADPAHVILGLPLYGRSWPVDADTIPAPATGRGEALPFHEAWRLAHGALYRLEPASQSLVLHRDGRQIWYGDTLTTRRRIQHVVDQTTLAGVGFWAVDYVSLPAFWAMVANERRVRRATVADRGRSRLPWPVLPIVGLAVSALLAWLLGATSTPWTRWYSGRRGETR